MYIDPNTGGMLFQVLAVLFGLFSGMILIFSSKIRMFFGRLNRMRHAEPEEVRFRKTGRQRSRTIISPLVPDEFNRSVLKSGDLNR